LSIIAKAKELADEIKESDEFKSLRSAETRAMLDPKAREIVDALRDKEREARMAQRSGRPLNQEEASTIQNLQTRAQQNESLKRLAAAQQEFDSVMEEVNRTIARTLYEAARKS